MCNQSKQSPLRFSNLVISSHSDPIRKGCSCGNRNQGPICVTKPNLRNYMAAPQNLRLRQMFNEEIRSTPRKDDCPKSLGKAAAKLPLVRWETRVLVIVVSGSNPCEARGSDAWISASMFTGARDLMFNGSLSDFGGYFATISGVRGAVGDRGSIDFRHRP